MNNSIDSILKGEKGLFFIAGPCVIESRVMCLEIASRLARCSEKFNTPIIFKASFDKANRTSPDSFRGPGINEGISILKEVKKQTGLSVLTDIHTPKQAEKAAEAADIIQIPAFLCRQTDLIRSASKTGKYVNIKKGQFLSPSEMKYSLKKSGDKTIITERGTFFGYNNLVVDFAGIADLKKLGVPVVFDAAHSVQRPGGLNGKSGGKPEAAIPLARAALSCNVDGLFFEVHPEPEKGLSDASSMLAVDLFEKEIGNFIRLSNLIKDF